MNTTVEILTRVNGSIPTTGLVLTMSRCMDVYTTRPVLTVAGAFDQVTLEQQYRRAA